MANNEHDLEDLVSADEAKELMDGPSPAYREFGDSDTLFYRLLRTVIDQDQEIESLR